MEETNFPGGPRTASVEWSVILLAGSRPGGDPLAKHFNAPTKALVPLGGRPMIAHVLDTLLAVPAVGSITVLAQDPQTICDHPQLRNHFANSRLTIAGSTDGIASSIAHHISTDAQPWPVLVTTADHPLLSVAMLDHFMTCSAECDIAIGLVSKATLAEESDPAQRTWLKFRDDAVSGANLFALRSPAVMEALRYWASLERHRKKPWRMAARLGPSLLFDVLLRRLSLDQAFDRAGQRLGVKAKAVRLPFPLAAVDVDKLSDHSEVEMILAKRQ